jgi:hypothetical protein
MVASVEEGAKVVKAGTVAELARSWFEIAAPELCIVEQHESRLSPAAVTIDGAYCPGISVCPHEPG